MFKKKTSHSKLSVVRKAKKRANSVQLRTASPRFAKSLV